MRKEDKAGLQLTVIVHLAVVIVLLLFGIGRELSKENSFILDFTRQEQLEEEQRQEEFEEKISRKLDRLIAEADASPIRNVAVSSQLRDDRHSAAEASTLMNDAERLAQNLRKGYKADIEEDAVNEAVDYGSASKKEKKQEYSGPSVLSWTLDGRKASHLPIPAYRCLGAGTVSVVINVDQQGNVVGARINETVSSDDTCLRNFAVRAARLSKFNRDLSAPFRQTGEIVYSFIAQ